MGATSPNFIYNPYDHDNDEKTFLGETGNFNGDDIVEIIARQQSAAPVSSPATSTTSSSPTRCRCRPGRTTPPRDPEAIALLEQTYFDSGYDLTAMLRGAVQLRLLQELPVREGEEPHRGGHRHHAPGAGLHVAPKLGLNPLANTIRYMGQDLMNPPTVEGWHTGAEWIDSGTLVERINFAADQVGNTSLPGIRDIVSRLGSEEVAGAENIVDRCLEMVGAYELAPETPRPS